MRAVLSGRAEADVLPHTREVSNAWSMSNDGKTYVGARLSAKDRRK